MGIVAGIVYEKKKNLLFPILVHVANNLIAMVQGFVPSGVDEMINIFVLIMIIPLGYVIYRLLRHKRVESIS